MLETILTPADGHVLVVLKGDITSAAAPQLDKFLAEVLVVAGQAPRCLVDLGALSFTSSAGLRSFLSLAKKVKNANGRLVFAAVQPAVLEVLEVSGFTRVLELAPDVQIARARITQA